MARTKWGQPHSLGELQNQSYDTTFRTFKVKPQGYDGTNLVTLKVDAFGRLLKGVEAEAFQATITSADAQSATQVKAKTSAKKMYIHTIIVSTDTAMNIQFQDDGTPTVLIEGLYLAANGGAVLTFDPSTPLVVTTNQDLDVIASAAGNISVTVTGYLGA